MPRERNTFAPDAIGVKNEPRAEQKTEQGHYRNRTGDLGICNPTLYR